MNSQLYEKTYRIPQHIVERVRAKLSTMTGGSNGIKRGKYIVNNAQCSYSMMKRLKNFFDYCDPNIQRDEYELAGGRDMQNFIERTLGSDRSLAKSRKATNNMLMPQMNQNTLQAQNGNVNLNVNEDFEGISKNGICVIFSRGNGDDKVLLLKRTDGEHWAPNKWALVGGKIEEGEIPEQGTIREVFEETQIQISNFIGDFIIRTNGDQMEFVYVAVVEGEPQVVLSSEHTDYGWFGTDEINRLDKSPNLDDFIALSKQKLIVWDVDNQIQ